MFNSAERNNTIRTAITFKVDLCASHSVISIETLSFLAEDHGSRICDYQDLNYNHPRIAMNYPLDCSAQLYTYHCRLFISTPGTETFELMDFFVVPGATNTL